MSEITTKLTWRHAALLGGLLTVSASGAIAQVGSETLACGEEREVQPGMISEGTYNRMNSAYELIGEEEYAEALEDLRKLADARLSDFERASVLQALGFVTSQLERYGDAVEYFEEAIRLDAMPNNTHFEMILQVAQLYNILEDYDRALEQLDFWFCVSTEEATKQANVWALKASLHAQKEEYQLAIDAIDEAIALREDPPENWYRMKLGMHLELEQYRPAIDTLEILVRMDPERKEYWIQMAGSYMELDESEKAMGALRLAYRKGLFEKGSEYSQLAGLLQEMGAPRQAAEVLEDGLAKGHVEATAQNWEIAAGAWYQAQEMDKALAAYERAGELSDSGKLDFQRASIMAADENWEGVLEAASRALDKGDLTDTQEGNSHLLIGMAQFNLDNLDAAEEAFNNAARYGRIRQAAQQWLNHIRQTRQRLASR